MKQIKVLGSDCRNCQTTYDLITKTAADLGVAVQLEKIEDIGQIMGYGVMSTPGVVINGKVVHAGGGTEPRFDRPVAVGCIGRTRRTSRRQLLQRRQLRRVSDPLPTLSVRRGVPYADDGLSEILRENRHRACAMRNCHDHWP